MKFVTSVLLGFVLGIINLFGQQTITIDVNNQFQTIDGIGASDCWNAEFVGKHWDDTVKEDIAKLLFSKDLNENGNPEGIGLSLWRHNIGAGSAEQGDESGIVHLERRAESYLMGPLENGRYRISLTASNKALTLDPTNLDVNGGNIQQNNWVAGLNQQWDLTNLGNGEYLIRNVESGKCMEAEGTANGTNVQQWDCGEDLRIWKAVHQGNGNFLFVNKGSGKALAVHGHQKHLEGASALIWNILYSNNFIWYVELLESTGESSYDWSKQSGARWFLHQANDYGVENFVAFSNSPPVHMTKNNLAHLDIGTNPSSTNLLDSEYDSFAKFLRDVLDFYKTEGIEFDYVSPINEPQHHWATDGQEGCFWTNQEIFNCITSLNQQLINSNLDSKIMITDAANYRPMYQFMPSAAPNTSEQLDHFFDPSSALFLGDLERVPHLMSGHSYWTDQDDQTILDTRSAVRAEADLYDVEIHQTEYSLLGGYNAGGSYLENALKLAKIIHSDMVITNTTSWSFWTALEKERWGHKNRFNLIELLPAGDPYQTLEHPGTIEAEKTLWALGNYSKFIRPGYKRIDLSGASDLAGLMGSAYISADGSEIIAVYVNYGSSEVSISQQINGLNDCQVKEIIPFITSANFDLERMESYSGDFVVPEKSIVTLQILLDQTSDQMSLCSSCIILEDVDHFEFESQDIIVSSQANVFLPDQSNPNTFISDLVLDIYFVPSKNTNNQLNSMGELVLIDPAGNQTQYQISDLETVPFEVLSFVVRKRLKLPIAKTNGDGSPWQIQFNAPIQTFRVGHINLNYTSIGLNPDEDCDGDGLTNSQELSLDRDPLDFYDCNFNLNGSKQNWVLQGNANLISEFQNMIRVRHNKSFASIQNDLFNFNESNLTGIEFRFRSWINGDVKLYVNLDDNNGYQLLGQKNYSLNNQWDIISFDFSNYPEINDANIVGIRIGLPNVGAISNQYSFIEYIRPILNQFKGDSGVYQEQTSIFSGRFNPALVSIFEDEIQNESVVVFPNPTSNKIFVKSKDFTIESLSDISGRILFENENASLEIRELSLKPYNGNTFFIKLIHWNGEIVIKKITRIH